MRGPPGSSAGAPRTLRARHRLLPLGHRTYIMAIINLTTNSFSGDGAGDDIEAAVRHAVSATLDGADIIDIGAESARADVPVRNADEEAQFVGEAITAIARETDALLSVDTYKGRVAAAAVQAGAHMINDIAGFKYDDGTARVAVATGAALVINYTFERPKVRPSVPPQYNDVIGEHLAFLRDQVSAAERLGIGAGQIVIDPGIAFGKSHDEDLEVLRQLPTFAALGYPVMMAASRKHFIGSVIELAPKDRDAATVAVTALSIAGGADIVRVHNVRANVEAARMADAIVRGRLGDHAASPESWPWAAGASPIPGTTIERPIKPR